MEDGIPQLGRWGRMEIVFATVVVTLTGVLLHRVVRSSRRLPPGPKGWPLVGAMPYVGEFPYRSFHELSRQDGPVMYMRLGAMSTLVISNGEMAKEVLLANDQVFASPPPLLVPAGLTYGLQDIGFAPYGHHWRNARKIANFQLLTASRLTHFTGILEDEILRTIHSVLEQSQSGGKDAVNLTALLHGMAMNNMTRMMWNRRHRNVKGSVSDRDEGFVKLIKTINSISGASNIADFLPSIFQSFAMKLSGLDRKTRDLHHDLDEFLESIIGEKELTLSMETKAAADDDDFVNVLLKLKNEPGDFGKNTPGLSREAMKVILMERISSYTCSNCDFDC